jgi:hypothetical protein
MTKPNDGIFALRLFTVAAFACWAAFCIGAECGREDRDAALLRAQCDLAIERGARRAWESEAKRYRALWHAERDGPELEVVTEGQP